jgi:hypothetical protein
MDCYSIISLSILYMQTKKKVSQKQKQKQSVTVNISLEKAKARAKSSAKKSGKGEGEGSVMMLPPPIYTSSIDRLTPAMYGSQGQQIQQRGMEDLLRSFLTNQQNQQTNAGFRNLGSAEPPLRSTSEFIPYDDSSNRSFRSLGSLSSLPGSSSLSYNPSSSNSLTDYGSNPSLNSLAYFPNQHSDSSLGSSTTSRYPILSSVGSSLSSTIPSSKSSLSRNYPDNISEITDPTYMSEDSSISKLMSTESQYDRALASPFSSDISDPFSMERSLSSKTLNEFNKIPIPFQNEERSYLRTAEPDYEKNIPKFSQNEAQVSQKNIYESSRRPQKRPPVKVELDEESITYQGTPASKVNIIPFEDEMSSDSLSNYSKDSLNTNPFPKNMYNKMMGFN